MATGDVEVIEVWIPVDDGLHLSERHSFTYGDSGEVVLTESETDGDGHLDLRVFVTYDEEANIVAREWDYLADGTVNGRVHYDPEGREIRSESDDDGDGIVDSAVAYHHDQAGNVVRVDYDYDGDSEVDRLCLSHPPCTQPFFHDCTFECTPQYPPW